jgi:hypothetical protein
MLAWVVYFGSTLRRSGKPNARKAIGAQGTFSLPFYIIVCLLPPPKSLPLNSFADLYPLNPVTSYRYKNMGWGRLKSPMFLTLFQVPYPVSPVFATLTNSAGVYTNNSHSGPSNSALPNGSNPYFLTLLTSLLPASPIAGQSLWCNNLLRQEVSSRSGETTPLRPVSKTTRADIGNGSSLVPFASRAWVQRFNALRVLMRVQGLYLQTLS